MRLLFFGLADKFLHMKVAKLLKIDTFVKININRLWR